MNLELTNEISSRGPGRAPARSANGWTWARVHRSTRRLTPARSRARSNRTRRGAALVEFAIVSLALYMLVASGIELGRLVFADQVIEDAARVAARELAVHALPANATFEEAWNDPLVRQNVFDPDKLVIVLSNFGNDAERQAYLANLPVVNRALLPLMITERTSLGGGSQVELMRYPGALFQDASSSTGYSVHIPRVVGRDASGVETIEWVDVLEEIRCDPCDPTTGPFSLVTPDPPPDCLPPAAARGLVALRINYPFQAAMLSGYRAAGQDALGPNGRSPNIAADGAVTVVDSPNCPPPAGTLIDPAGGSPTYSGPYGLGNQMAQGVLVRPFRRLITAQAIFRREVVQ